MDNLKKKPYFIHMNQKTLLTTRFTDDLYQLLVKACVDDLKKSEKKIKNIKVEVIKLRKIPDIKFLLKCVIYFLQGKFFFRKKIILLKYEGINFGKHLFTFTMRNYESYLSSYKFYYHLIVNICVISKIFKTADYYLKHCRFEDIYIDHPGYLNGIFYQIFISKNKRIYTNNYPKNVLKTKNKKLKDIFKLDFKKVNFSNVKQEKIIKKTKKIFRNGNNSLFWMANAKYNLLKKQNFKKYDYIIYTHSFTDSQLLYGYDGFLDTLEWLEFTTKELQNRKVNFIIKAHPNFYTESFGDLAAWDRKIYTNFLKKIKDDRNILIINESILNSDLIKLLNKKCVAITKNGNAQLEMVHNNFKVISSKCNYLDHKYKLFNTWGNKKDYKKLLNQKWDKLKFCNKKNYLNVINRLYLDEDAFYGDNFYMHILQRYMIKERLAKKDATIFDVVKKFNSLNNKKDIVDKINVPVIKF